MSKNIMSMKNSITQANELIVASRENGISYALFRNAIGKKLALNTTDFEGLDLVFFRGATTPTELSKYTGLSSGSTTAMIDRLERAGLVRRQSNPNDRRGTLIVIDEQASHNIGPLFASVRKAQHELLAGYSPEELRTISDYFNKSTVMFESEREKII